MRRLGVSIYPEKSSENKIKNYLKEMAAVGCSRIFSCLLSAEESKDEIIKRYKAINEYAHSLGYEVIVDVSPRVFNKLNIGYDDLVFFNEISADGLRLDVGFTGAEEALMTYNEYGLKIEINMSNNTHTIDTIMDYQPNQYKLYGCHNFYPHQKTGLPLEYFEKCTQRFNKYNLKTAAFVTSQADKTFGPWPVTDGLSTLEIHRNLPLHVQIKHFLALDTIDDIIISNCYPTKDEISQIRGLDLNLVTFNVRIVENLPETEREILFEMLHWNRGDINEHLIRSTQSRVKYKQHTFDLFNAPDTIHRGDIIIESSEYGHYAGELQIAKQEMKNSGKSNVVGHVEEDEIFILDYIKPWQKFKLKEG